MMSIFPTINDRYTTSRISSFFGRVGLLFRTVAPLCRQERHKCEFAISFAAQCTSDMSMLKQFRVASFDFRRTSHFQHPLVVLGRFLHVLTAELLAIFESSFNSSPVNHACRSLYVLRTPVRHQSSRVFDPIFEFTADLCLRFFSWSCSKISNARVHTLRCFPASFDYNFSFFLLSRRFQ